FRRPVLGKLMTQFFSFGLAFSGFMSGFALFAERRYSFHNHAVGAREVGYFYTCLGFFGIFVQGYLLGKVVKRFGEKNLVVFGFLAQGVGYAMIGLTFHIPALFLAAIVASTGSGI